MLQLVILRFQFPDADFSILTSNFHLFIQPLDRRQCHAALVNRRDVLVIRADVERRIKILRHRADVPLGRLKFVTPLADGQLQDFLQDLRRAHRGEILLDVAVTRGTAERSVLDRHGSGADVQSDDGRGIYSTGRQLYIAITCRKARGAAAGVENVARAAGIVIIVVAQMNAIAEAIK